MAVYRRSDSQFEELIIPQTRDFADYASRMGEALDILARYERRPLQEVITDLLLPPADIVRFRLDDRRTAGGVIPLLAGLSFYDGTRRALLSAACSVLQPQAFHPRLSRTDAEQFLESCQMKAEPPSSFLATLVCPLADAPNQDELSLSGSDESHAPFTRRAVLYLIRSVDSLVSAILGGTEDDLLKPVTDPRTPVVSANLCEALTAMRPEGERSSLEIIPTWSRNRPMLYTAPSRVTIRREFFPHH